MTYYLRRQFCLELVISGNNAPCEARSCVPRGTQPPSSFLEVWLDALRTWCFNDTSNASRDTNTVKLKYICGGFAYSAITINVGHLAVERRVICHWTLSKALLKPSEASRYLHYQRLPCVTSVTSCLHLILENQTWSIQKIWRIEIF